MKAVILEVKNGDAAALKDDGTVVKIKDENYKVGDVIRMKEKKPLFNKKWGTLVAALLIFAMVGTSTYVNAAPNFDVYVEDINEDYEFLFRVNKLGKVVDVFVGREKDEPIEFNDENLTLEGMGIEEAIDAVLLDQGWDDETIITVAAKDKDDAEKIAQRIRDRINEDEGDGELERTREEKTIESISNEMVREAREVGISPGKVNIVEKLFEGNDRGIEIGDRTFRTSGAYLDFIKGYTDDEEATPEEIKENTKALMKDLMKAYSESKGNKEGMKFQEDLDDENEDGKVNGKDKAPGQLMDKDKSEVELELEDDNGNQGKEKSNKGNGNN